MAEALVLTLPTRDAEWFAARMTNCQLGAGNRLAPGRIFSELESPLPTAQ